VVGNILSIVIFIFSGAVFADEQGSLSPDASSAFRCPQLEVEKLIRVKREDNSESGLHLELFTEPGIQFIRQTEIDKIHSLWKAKMLPFWDKNFKDLPAPQIIRIVWTKAIGVDALFCDKEQTLGREGFSFYMSATQQRTADFVFFHLAHEAVHFYYLQQPVRPPDWLEEGLALLVESKLTGLFPRESSQAHQLTPFVGFEEVSSDETGFSAYGHSFLFLHFLSSILGGDLVGAFNDSKIRSIEGMEAVLRKLESPRWSGLAQAFLEFEIAKRVNRYGTGYFLSNSIRRASDRVNPAQHKLSEWASQVVAVGPVRYRAPGEVLESGAARPEMIKVPKGSLCFAVLDSPGKDVTYRECPKVFRQSDLVDNEFVLELKLPRYLHL
jgi:hypothetical protein